MNIKKKVTSVMLASVMLFGTSASAHNSSIDYINDEIKNITTNTKIDVVSTRDNKKEVAIVALKEQDENMKKIDDMIKNIEQNNSLDLIDIDSIKKDIIENKVIDTKNINKDVNKEDANESSALQNVTKDMDASKELVDSDALQKLTLEDAIDIAMENNTILKGLSVDIEAAGLTLEETNFNKKKLKDGDKNIKKASQTLNDLNNILSQIPDNMKDKSLNEIAKYNPALANAMNSNKDLASLGNLNKEQINNNVITPGKESLDKGITSLDIGLETSNSVIANKLNLSVDKVMGVNSTTDLMVTMAQLQNEVTKSGYEMAQRQVALLTRQKYYEVLKCKRIEELKKAALDRANKQYTMAKDAYEAGMKAKDDMLLAQSQSKLMNVDYRVSSMNTQNAIIDLKKTIGIDMKTPVTLVEDFTTEKIDIDLNNDIAKGLDKRIEIRKSLAQYLIDKLNFELTSRTYPDMTFQYKDASIKMEKSKVTYDSQAQEVEASIRQSYESVIATEDMISYIEDVVENARESLDIAQLRYNEGYGFETTVIKGANMEDVAGTMAEVLAAQERLTDIEEKVVEVIFNYNLARDKYLTDIGTY